MKIEPSIQEIGTHGLLHGQHTAEAGQVPNQCFTEAHKILDGLNALHVNIASNIEKAYELVQSGLKSFVDNSPRSGGKPKNCSHLNRVAMR